MNPILAAAAEIDRYCTRAALDFCIIGGIAVLRWGQPRLTRDVDLTVVTGFGAEESVIDPLLTDFTARFADGRAFALRHRVLLLSASNGVPIDVALGRSELAPLLELKGSTHQFSRLDQLFDG